MSIFNEESLLDKFIIWHSTEFKLAGGLIAILGIMFLLPSLFALLVNEDMSPFLYPAIPLITTGLFIYLVFAPSKNLRTVNGLMMVAMTWLIMFFVGAIPYIIVGMSPVNALFESVNGFTTTGSTTIESVYYWPLSLMFWRAMSQWIGGIAIVIIFIYMLPLFGMGRLFFNNELEGSGSSHYSMKLQNAAKSFILVYVLLSIINFVILFIVGADMIDAICLSLTTISTGGVIISNTSLIETATPVQVVTLIFMFIGGTNFYLHFKAIYGRNLKAYLSSKEITHMALYFLLMSIILLGIKIGGLSHLNMDFDNLLQEYWAILFTVVSMGTTTGTTIYDFSNSSELMMFLLIILMMVGASAGSTSGGIKFTRVRIVMRFFNNAFMTIIHPNAVYSVKVDEEHVDDTRVMSAITITLLYMVTVLVSMIILMTSGMNWVDAIGLAVGSISNTGVGFGHFGPLGDYDILSNEIKIFLMFLMWIGRLEITLALVFFTPGFWKELRYSYRSSVIYRKLAVNDLRNNRGH